MNFDKPDRRARLSQLGFLMRHTFSILGRNHAVLTPVLAMWIYATALVTVFFAALVMIVYKFFFYNSAELTLSRLTGSVAKFWLLLRCRGWRARSHMFPSKHQDCRFDYWPASAKITASESSFRYLC